MANPGISTGQAIKSAKLARAKELRIDRKSSAYTMTLTKSLTPTNTYTDTPTVTITQTPTDTETPTTTQTPIPTITLTFTPTSMVPTGETWLYYYYSGTTRIAMRQISQYGDTVMFLLTDHLGSSSIVTDSQGAKIGEVRYKAWGETRYDSGNVPTKQRYTGQRDETELGLIYYGARWYDPSIGRFNQADTIIPQAGNALAWDRYSYVLNNPARLVDPTGHVYSHNIPTPSTCNNSHPACLEPNNVQMPTTPLVKFSVDPSNPQSWTSGEMNAIQTEAMSVAKAYANAINITRMNDENNELGLISPYDAYYLIHGGPINFIRSSTLNPLGNYSGRSVSKNEIWIYNMEYPVKGKEGLYHDENYVVNHPHVIAHEIGHSFDFANNTWGGTDIQGSLAMAGLMNRDSGFAGGLNWWQFSDRMTSGEIFADMFVGWVYGQWDTNDPSRGYFMSSMSPFIVNNVTP